MADDVTRRIHHLLRQVDAYLRIAATLIGFAFGIALFMLAALAALIIALLPTSHGLWSFVFPILIAVGWFFPAWCALRAGIAVSVIANIAWRIPMYAALGGWTVLLASIARDFLIVLKITA
jgi:hypothetical protein